MAELKKPSKSKKAVKVQPFPPIKAPIKPIGSRSQIKINADAFPRKLPNK